MRETTKYYFNVIENKDNDEEITKNYVEFTHFDINFQKGNKEKLK